MERARAKAYSSVWIQGVTFLPFRHTRQGRRWWWLLWVLLWMACSVNTLCFEHLFNLKPGFWTSYSCGSAWHFQIHYFTPHLHVPSLFLFLGWGEIAGKRPPTEVDDIQWSLRFTCSSSSSFTWTSMWIREGFFWGTKNINYNLVNWNVECEEGGGLIP